jgi:hypothetical protein
MPNSEDQPVRFSPDGEPLFPSELPPALADFLRRANRYARVTQTTDQGTAYVLKVPGQELATLRGTMPIGLRHELYEHVSMRG